jgi:hypothetical protein
MENENQPTAEHPDPDEAQFGCALQCQQLPLPGFTYWQEHPRALLSEWRLEVENGVILFVSTNRL